jgi:hypothetical protein
MAILLFALCLTGGNVFSDYSKGPGYLPVVGPAPMRFQPAPQAMPALPWPSLLKSDPQPARDLAQDTNALAVAQSPAEPYTNAAPPAVITANAAANPAPVPPSTALVPLATTAPVYANPMAGGPMDLQALLSYLGPTNRSAAQVIMPVFVPPQAPQYFPSSRATYESR